MFFTRNNRGDIEKRSIDLLNQLGINDKPPNGQGDLQQFPKEQRIPVPRRPLYPGGVLDDDDGTFYPYPRPVLFPETISGNEKPFSPDPGWEKLPSTDTGDDDWSIDTSDIQDDDDLTIDSIDQNELEEALRAFMEDLKTANGEPTKDSPDTANGWPGEAESIPNFSPPKKTIMRPGENTAPANAILKYGEDGPKAPEIQNLSNTEGSSSFDNTRGTSNSGETGLRDYLTAQGYTDINYDGENTYAKRDGVIYRIDVPDSAGVRWENGSRYISDIGQVKASSKLADYLKTQGYTNIMYDGENTYAVKNGTIHRINVPDSGVSWEGDSRYLSDINGVTSEALSAEESSNLMNKDYISRIAGALLQKYPELKDQYPELFNYSLRLNTDNFGNDAAYSAAAYAIETLLGLNAGSLSAEELSAALKPYAEGAEDGSLLADNSHFTARYNLNKLAKKYPRLFNYDLVLNNTYSQDMDDALWTFLDKFDLSGKYNGLSDDVKYSALHGWLQQAADGIIEPSSHKSGAINQTLYDNDNVYKHEADSISQIISLDTTRFSHDISNFKEIYESNEAIYKEIARRTGIPSELIAAIHYRESGCNFSTYLHNGDPLGKPTTHVPEGIYFDNFVDAAVDALWGKVYLRERYELTSDSNDMAAMMAFAEAYNGLGYYNYHDDTLSPYVYSGTNVYKKGKYVSDGKYSPETIDAQPGVFLLLKSLKS